MSLPKLGQPAEPELMVPRDHVFDRWAGDAIGDGRFVWLAEHGMGRLLVSDPPYDAAYFENYQRLAASAMGQQITAARMALVRRHVRDGELVVDVGIGCGTFVEAARAAGLHCYGYDVNMTGVRWLHERHLWHNPYDEPVDALTMWDVLEHVLEPKPLLDAAGKWVFCSLPIVPDLGPPSALWRHYKPREHCWYWTRSGFVSWMREHGFKLVGKNRVESDIGRLDIETFAFRRVGS